MSFQNRNSLNALLSSAEEGDEKAIDTLVNTAGLLREEYIDSPEWFADQLKNGSLTEDELLDFIFRIALGQESDAQLAAIKFLLKRLKGTQLVQVTPRRRRY
ncbi:MAG: hypothetical protein Sylvanvirus2_25 [Sylvanvirus sp.]|uniref:Uncharacterized protein n=1 Tax=Sylvanvirus sp. TaxID=2487774 RepID=A0A3G5AKS0_9VIRU|nr:MAG: hypothetical protein Sylvanvirus2_25 [Sylvanvirus sp.]